MTRTILPGSTVGLLGSGQLGRMFAIAARRMGYRVHVFSPERDTPAGQLADLEACASYDDLDAVRAFASAVDVITFEFENVSAAAAAEAAAHTVLRPNWRALEVAQHRIREKAFLQHEGLPVAPCAPVRTDAELAAAVSYVGTPAVLKTAAFGYDGKGQLTVASPGQAQDAWAALGRREAILEAFVELEREISVIGARGPGGEWSHFGPFENVHRRHILDLSIAPPELPASLTREAVEATRHIMDALDMAGLLCVEFFVSRAGRLLINELAPRPHNSGHLTFDACRTSQFEQHLRAVCGLPLGSAEMLQPAAMVNLLGDLWANGEPDWTAALSHRRVKLHLYGKREPRPGRKMGHLTALAPTVDAARREAIAAREALVPPTR